MSETTAALGAESTPINPNIRLFKTEFEAARWITQDTIERLAEGEEDDS